MTGMAQYLDQFQRKRELKRKRSNTVPDGIAQQHTLKDK